MFANHGKEDGIYPLTTLEIATSQKKDHQIYFKNMQNIKSGFAFSAIEDIIVLYNNENQSSQHLYR
jgi:hypothetical protein